MRGCGAGAAGRCATLPDNYGFGFIYLPDQLGEFAPILDSLQIYADDFGLVVVGQVFQKVNAVLPVRWR